jgi:hypothetical protein
MWVARSAGQQHACALLPPPPVRRLRTDPVATSTIALPVLRGGPTQLEPAPDHRDAHSRGARPTPRRAGARPCTMSCARSSPPSSRNSSSSTTRWPGFRCASRGRVPAPLPSNRQRGLLEDLDTPCGRQDLVPRLRSTALDDVHSPHRRYCWWLSGAGARGLPSVAWRTQRHDGRVRG